MTYSKSLRLVCLSSLTFLMAPGVSLAVGLGTIQMSSYLNEPLKAQIPIETPEEVALSEIKVRLANGEAFEKAGIERPYFLTQFDYQVKGKPGDAYIEVTSHYPIRNPFLSFILEANWASGKVQREYTVLLDPVEYKPKAKRKTIATTQVRPHPASAAKKALNTSIPSNHQGVDYQVKANDTLSQIAKPVAQAHGADVNQAMLAIARKNPDAFIGGNLNGLKKGANLTFPSESEIFELSASEAIARATEHQKAWRYGQAVAPLQPLATTQQPEKALTLVMPTVPTSSSAQKPRTPTQTTTLPNAWSHKPVADSNIQKTQNRLLLIEETLDTLKQTNQTLQQQQLQLQEQNSKLMAILSQKDDKIEQLTETLNQLAKQTFESSSNPALTEEYSQSTTDAVIASPSSGIKTESVELPEPQKAQMDDSVAPQETKTKLSRPVPAEPIVPLPQPTQAAPAQNPEGFSYWWLIIAGLATFGIAGAGYEIYRRRFLAKDSFDFEEEGPIHVETPLNEEFEDAASADDIEDALSVFGEELDDDRQTAEQYEPNFEDLEEGSSSSDMEVGASEDVLSEVDVYISYENFDKAENLLKGHLDTHPDDAQAHLKLLELYEKSENPQALQSHIQTLPKGLVDQSPEIFQKIQSLFEAPAKPVAQDKVQAEDAISEQVTKEQEDTKESMDFDFDLNQKDSSSKADTNAQESTSKAESEDESEDEETQESNALEFSLKPEASKDDQIETTEDDDTQMFDLSQEYDLSLSPSTEDSDEASSAKDSSKEDAFDELDDDSSDPIGTKIALAQAYLDLGDKEGAVEHLEVVLKEGNDKQKAMAQEMLSKTKE